MEIHKKFETVPFSATHLDVMELREEEKEGVMALEGIRERFEGLAERCIDSKSFLYDGRIIFCAGYFELWPGVIECWMMPSIYVQTVKIEFCRLLRSYVSDIMIGTKCHRFQTPAPDDELHARWMRFLGLKREGVMKKYTHNQKDYCLYARTV